MICRHDDLWAKSKLAIGFKQTKEFVLEVYVLLWEQVWIMNSLLWIFMCSLSSSAWSNVLSQRSHVSGLSLAWLRRTWLSWAAWEAKAFPQCLHLNGLSPECCLMCVRRMLEAVNACNNTLKNIYIYIYKTQYCSKVLANLFLGKILLLIFIFWILQHITYHTHFLTLNFSFVASTKINNFIK